MLKIFIQNLRMNPIKIKNMDDYKYGRELIFISQIARDGSGVIPCKEDMSNLDDYDFKMSRLSITNGTWIAACMNVYIVKLKN